jgi:YVTN family beta-propeller protein
VRSIFLSLIGMAALLTALGCRHSSFPDFPEGYREYAYVSNGASNTVSVLDLVNLRQDRTLRVGDGPSGMAVNPRLNEVYAVNSRSGTISIIDTQTNQVAATVGVQRAPYFISVDAAGDRAYVANSGSNTVSVIDLHQRRQISVAGTGDQPGVAKISPDGHSLIVTNRGSGSISIFAVGPSDTPGRDVLRLRAAFAGCAGATDAIILPDSSKTFVACSGAHKVMAIQLAAAPGSWAARQDPSQLEDHLLTLLDVGDTPVHLALKADGGEIFVSNFESDSITEISTWTNEVGGTYMIGTKPVRGVVSRDNSSLWVSNFGAASVSLYSIDDGRLISSIRTGAGPDALAFSTDDHLLLVTDTRSGDVTVIRTQGRMGAALFTTLPAGGSPNDIVVKSFMAKP